MNDSITPRDSPSVTHMLQVGQLVRVVADAELASVVLDRARGRARSARRALESGDLEECVSPLWDAVRLGCVAILQAQGLRAAGEGHHLAVLEAVSEQYGHVLGPGLKPGKRLREARRANEYPVSTAADPLDAADIADDLGVVVSLLDAVDALLPSVPVFR